MRPIKLICDSSCDLSQEVAKEIGLDIEPLQISFGPNETYKDGVDIDAKKLYARVDEIKVLPHTAAMQPREYYALFDKYIEEGFDIIYTGIGSGFSSSYSTGVLVSKDFDQDHVEVVDSQNLSAGIALILLKALEAIKAGKNVHEVANLMRELAPKVRSQFAIDTMEFLHKGGRCSGMTKLLGTVLKIKPVIEVRDNKMVVGPKPRGKLVIAIDKMLEMLAEDKDNLDSTSVIYIAHSMAHAYVSQTKEKIEQIVPGAKVVVTEAGGIVSCHCGPNTVGIFWLLK